MWVLLGWVLISGSHQADIQIAGGLWSHQRLRWGNAITFKLLQVVGRVYFLEVVGLTSHFLAVHFGPR